MDGTQEEWLSPAQAARRLGVSAEWIRDLADSGKLVAMRTPLGRLVSAAAVEKLAQERARQRPVGERRSRANGGDVG